MASRTRPDRGSRDRHSLRLIQAAQLVNPFSSFPNTSSAWTAWRGPSTVSPLAGLRKARQLVSGAHGTFRLWARVANRHSAPSKDVFTGANYSGEHPLIRAVKVAVFLDIVGVETLNGLGESSAR